MSSHYIFLSCATPECDTTETLYTGNIYSELFDDSGPDSWEGETISVKCKQCQAES